MNAKLVSYGKASFFPVIVSFCRYITLFFRIIKKSQHIQIYYFLYFFCSYSGFKELIKKYKYPPVLGQSILYEIYMRVNFGINKFKKSVRYFIFGKCDSCKRQTTPTRQRIPPILAFLLLFFNIHISLSQEGLVILY